MENTNQKVTTPNQVAVENSIQLKNNTITQKELVYLLKQTFPALSQNQYFYAVSQCKAYGLDPRTKEIYFVPFNGKDGQTIASITSYEVYNRELRQAGYYKVPQWKGDEDIANPQNLMIKVSVYDKNNNNTLCYQTPWISIKEYAKMDYKKEKLVGMWANFPSLMLEKCVSVRIARMVLGNNLGYIAEELYNAKPYGVTDEMVKSHQEEERKVNIALNNETNK